MTRFAKLSAMGCLAGVLGLGSFASAGTIAQFNFDTLEGGQTFTDISGNGRDLVFNRIVELQDANPFSDQSPDPNDKSLVEKVNKGSQVTSGRLEKVETVDLTKNRSFTIEAWVNPSARNQGSDVARIIQFDSKAGGTTNIFLGINAEGKAVGRVYAKGAGSSMFAGDAEVPLNKWTHLALAYDGKEATLYVNGKEAARQRIGRSLPKSFSRVAVGSHFLGALDDVRISDEALAPEQLGLHKSFTGEQKEAPKSE
jgi:hypothetical protein